MDVPTGHATFREGPPKMEDRIINGLFLFLFFVTPLSRAGINIVAPLLLFVWLFKKIKLRRELQEKFRYLEILKWIGFLGLAILLSLVNAKNYATAFKNIVDEYILLASIFILSLDVIENKAQFQKLIWAGLAALVIVAGVGMYQYIVQGQARIGSTFSVATQTGVYLAGTALLNLAFLLFRKKFSSLVFGSSALLFFANLACLLMTGTRAAWLGFFAGAIFLLFLALKNREISPKKIIPKIIIVVVIMMLAAVLIGWGSVLERLASITDLSNGSNQQRIKMLQGGWAMLKDHPLIGVGIGQFPIVYANYLLPGAKIYTHIHCFYMHLLVELGLIGFTVFLILVYNVLKTGINTNAHLDGERTWFYYGVLGALVGIGVCNLFDWTFLNLQVGSFTLMLAGMWLNERRAA